MEPINIMCLVIYVIVAAVMIVLGISQVKSKKPVGFYSGEKHPQAENLKDVSAWNKKHGIMWIIYGIIILVSFVLGMCIGDSIWSVLPMCGGIIIPVLIMIWYHNKLIKDLYIINRK